MQNRYFSRRDLLKTGAALPFASLPLGLNGFALNAANAQTASDYKALVCVFLNGGNDSMNTVLPTDDASWNIYASARGVITLARDKVLPITPVTPQSGRSFALNPNMPGVQRLFDSGRLAIVANVGALIVPLTKATYGSLRKPRDLYSHSNQIDYWQQGEPAPGAVGAATNGWGGRMADALRPQNGVNSLFSCIAVRESPKFLVSSMGAAYTVSSYVPKPNDADAFMNNNLFGSSIGSNVARSVATTANANLIERAYADVTLRSINNAATFGAAVTASTPTLPAPLPFVRPSNGATSNDYLGRFESALRVIAASQALGIKRQIIYIEFSGYDSHANSNVEHNDNMAQLADGLEYFDLALANVNGQDLRGAVTTFTTSDFGRAMAVNGSGTDHGWGGHHFVMGGAVKGKDIYGAFPNYDRNGPDLIQSSSILLPTLAAEQYFATLARWFGLTDPQIQQAFPYVANFNSNNLGFMNG